jgi:hypothetical protein
LSGLPNSFAAKDGETPPVLAADGVLAVDVDFIVAFGFTFGFTFGFIFGFTFGFTLIIVFLFVIAFVFTTVVGSCGA